MSNNEKIDAPSQPLVANARVARRLASFGAGEILARLKGDALQHSSTHIACNVRMCG